jgi:hypothetical protein
MANSPFQYGLGAGIGAGVSGGGPQQPQRTPYYNPQQKPPSFTPAEAVGGHMLSSYLNYGPQVGAAMGQAGGIHAGNQAASAGQRAQNYGWAAQAGKLPFDVASNTGKGQMGDFSNWLNMNGQVAQQDDKMAQQRAQAAMRMQNEQHDRGANEREQNKHLMISLMQSGLLSPFMGGLGGFNTNFGASGGFGTGTGIPLNGTGGGYA